MWFKYLAAQIYDSFIIIALFFAFTTLCLIANHGFAIPPATRWYQLSLLGLFIGYYLLSVVYGGQTIGMRAWRLQLQTDLGRPSWQQAIGRLLLIFPALLGGLLSFKNQQQLLYRWTKTKLKSF
ncbi:RDD family protein [Legionella brunensis]|uniref:RDD family protein n=1 Tax=Legionella brunensis TaxID=29422 RepID=A0A0W0S0Q7_9GAMM|nr:RDD family protein [Legionella brunensis]KTC76826.1 RDD family protein [Legionella brunensis]